MPDITTTNAVFCSLKGALEAFDPAVWGTVSNWGLLAVGAFSIWTWRSNQKSIKRASAIAFPDNFTDTPGARNASLMLSARSREIPLWDYSEPAKRYVRVEWSDIATAFTHVDK